MELFFRAYGQGRPMVILHGLLGISDNWVSFGKAMAADGFRVIIPDQRNHGRSPHHDVFNYYALTDDLLELTEKLGLVKPVVVGHSMGGKVAMRYTLENPAQVARLIVVDTSLRTYTHVSDHRNLIDAMLSVDFAKARTRQEIEAQIKERIGEGRILKFLLKNIYPVERNKFGWRPDLESIGSNLEAMYDGVFYSSRYPGPALFVRGGLSNYILPEDHPSIMNHFPMAVIRTIKNGTHWVHADDPAAFLAMVREFLADR